jgi:hypothetical protein
VQLQRCLVQLLIGAKQVQQIELQPYVFLDSDDWQTTVQLHPAALNCCKQQSSSMALQPRYSYACSSLINNNNQSL